MRLATFVDPLKGHDARFGIVSGDAIVDVVAAADALHRAVPATTVKLALTSGAHTLAALKDLAVRQALYYAMDKKSIIDAIYYGLPKPTESFLPSQSWAFNPDLPKQVYDPAKAKQILLKMSQILVNAHIDLWTVSPQTVDPEPAGVSGYQIDPFNLINVDIAQLSYT